MILATERDLTGGCSREHPYTEGTAPRMILATELDLTGGCYREHPYIEGTVTPDDWLKAV